MMDLLKQGIVELSAASEDCSRKRVIMLLVAITKELK